MLDGKGYGPDTSYAGLWSGNPNVNGVTLPDGTVLNGNYDPSWIHFATAGLSIKL